MTGTSRDRSRHMLGPLLASIMVLFYGGMGIALVIAAAGGDPVIGLGIFVALSGVFLGIAFLLRSLPKGSFTSFDWLRRRPQVAASDYTPQPREKAQRKNFGTNRPPSVDDVRDAKDGLNNWVPSNSPRSRPRSSRNASHY